MVEKWGEENNKGGDGFHISDPCDTVLQTVSLDKGVYRRNSKHPSNRYTMRDPQRQHRLFKEHKVDTHLN
jgi:hypothetical protein